MASRFALSLATRVPTRAERKRKKQTAVRRPRRLWPRPMRVGCGTSGSCSRRRRQATRPYWPLFGKPGGLSWGSQRSMTNMLRLWSLWLAAALTLSACGTSTVREHVPAPAEREPIDLGCDASCFVECEPLPPIPVADDGSADPDDVGRAALEDAAALSACEGRRAACAGCLRRGAEQNVLRIKGLGDGSL